MTDLNKKIITTFVISELHRRRLEKIVKKEKMNKSEIIRQLIDMRWETGEYENPNCM